MDCFFEQSTVQDSHMEQREFTYTWCIGMVTEKVNGNVKMNLTAFVTQKTNKNHKWPGVKEIKYRSNIRYGPFDSLENH